MSAVGPVRCGRSDGGGAAADDDDEEEEGDSKREDKTPVRDIVRVARAEVSSPSISPDEGGGGGGEMARDGCGMGILAIALRIARRFETVRLSCLNSRTSWDVRRRWV
jgi:hypothetical protein